MLKAKSANYQPSYIMTGQFTSKNFTSFQINTLHQIKHGQETKTIEQELYSTNESGFELNNLNDSYNPFIFSAAAMASCMVEL